MQPSAAAQFPAAAIQPGYTVAYIVDVDGKEILSRGEVFAIRRTGANLAEITLLHAKTGALFTNELEGDAAVLVHSDAFAVLADSQSTDPMVDLMRDALCTRMIEQAKAFYARPIAD